MTRFDFMDFAEALALIIAGMCWGAMLALPGHYRGHAALAISGFVALLVWLVFRACRPGPDDPGRGDDDAEPPPPAPRPPHIRVPDVASTSSPWTKPVAPPRTDRPAGLPDPPERRVVVVHAFEDKLSPAIRRLERELGGRRRRA